MPNILMPALSPTMEEGKLSKWLVKVGDTVKPGDVLAEIETDKATMEVESVDSGKVTEILIAEGTEGVKVNAPIAVILGEGESAPRACAGGEDRARAVGGAGRGGREGRRCRAVATAAAPAAPKFEAAGRSRPAGRRRDGRDDRAPGAQRGDGRGDAPRQGRLHHGRGGRRVSGRLQDHPGAAAGIRAAARRRYADHRARLCRHRRRRGVRGAAADRRVHDLELRHAGDRPDHQLRRQAALYVGRAGDARRSSSAARTARRRASVRSTARISRRGTATCRGSTSSRRSARRTPRDCSRRRSARTTPVVFLENEILYGSTGLVPKVDDYVLPIGKARIARPGKDVTIVSLLDGHALRHAGDREAGRGGRRCRADRSAHAAADGHRHRHRVASRRPAGW